MSYFSVKSSEMSFLVREALESALSVESSEMRFLCEETQHFSGSGKSLSDQKKS